MDINSIVNAVLLNNPQAVAEKLVQLGIIQSSDLNTDALKTILYNLSLNRQDTLVIQAISVPILSDQPYAEELRNLAKPSTDTNTECDCSSQRKEGITLKIITQYGLVLFLFLSILLTLKQLFK